MTGWIENDIAKFEGLDDADIATINKRLPDLLNLIVVARANQAKAADLLAIIANHQAQAERVLTDLLPIAEKLIAKQRSLGT